MRFFVGLLIMVTLALVLAYVGVQETAYAPVELIEDQHKPLATLFLMLTTLMLPYSELTGQQLSFGIAGPPVNPTYTLLALGIASFAGGLIVSKTVKAAKMALTGVLILTLLWLPLASLVISSAVGNSSEAVLSLDALISEVLLNRPLDLLLFAVLPVAMAGAGGFMTGGARDWIRMIHAWLVIKFGQIK